MTQYWVIINGEKVGPLSLDEARRLNPGPNVLVWHRGLDGWRQARFISELNVTDDIARSLNAEPSASDNTSTRQTVAHSATPPMPPTYLGWSIASIILCCLPLGVVATIYSSQVSTYWHRGEYDKARQASERAQLWLITAVTLGLVSLPFQILLSAL